MLTNVSINLLMIKFRQQFGLRPFAPIFLGAYAAITFAHLFVLDFSSAIVVRAVSGAAAAPVSSLGLYYMMQALPANWRLKGVVLGIRIPRCATPLARLFSPELLAMSQWRTLYLFELGMALLSLAAIAWLRLPPTVRQKAFEPLDFLTFAYRKAALTAFREVYDSLAGVQRSGEQATASAAQRGALAAALNNARNRYRVGYSCYLEQLAAQRRRLSAELTLIQSESDRPAAYVAFYQAMGGGWSPEDVAAVGR